MTALSNNKITYQIVGDDKQLMQDLDRAEKGIESRSGSFAGAAKKLGGAIGGALATKQIFEWGSSFETSMAAASTLFGEAQVNADTLNKDMLALSNSTGIAADQLGGALYNALSAGVPASDDMSEALAFLESSSRLAVAGFTDIDTAQSATIKTLNAYKMDISEADKIQKILIQTQNKGIVTVGELGNVLAQVTPTAAAMNVSFEQVGAGIANMTAQGTPAAQATTQLNSLFAELGKEGTQAQKNLMKAAEGTKHAGKSFQQLMKEGVPLNEILDMMGDYAEANGVGMLDMFSSIEAGKAALANGGQNSKAFAEALESMSTETDVVGESFDKVSNTSAYKFNELMNQLKNIAIDLFLAIAPLLTEILPVLGELLGAIIPPLAEIVKTFLEPLVGILGTLLEPLSAIVEFLMPLFVTILNELLAPIKMFVDALRELIDFLIGYFSENWEKMWNTVKEFFFALWEAISSFFVDLWNGIYEFIESILTSISEFFEDIWNGIKETAEKIWNAFKQFFTDIWESIKNTITTVWDAITGFFTDTWNRIKGVAEGVFGALKSFFESIWNTISGVFDHAVGRIRGVIDDLKSGIEQTISGIRSIFQGLIDFISGVFTGDWGRAWEGIKEMFGGAFDAMVGLMKTPVNWIIDGINIFIGGLNKIKIPKWVPGLGGKGIDIPTIPRLKIGMEYVPDDEFPALLHAGEAVLTKEQADRWRRGLPRFENYHQYDFAGSNNVTVKNEMVGIVEMDGYNVGKIVLRNIDEVREMG